MNHFNRNKTVNTGMVLLMRWGTEFILIAPLCYRMMSIFDFPANECINWCNNLISNILCFNVWWWLCRDVRHLKSLLFLSIQPWWPSANRVSCPVSTKLAPIHPSTLLMSPWARRASVSLPLSWKHTCSFQKVELEFRLFCGSTSLMVNRYNGML